MKIFALLVLFGTSKAYDDESTIWDLRSVRDHRTEAVVLGAYSDRQNNRP